MSYPGTWWMSQAACSDYPDLFSLDDSDRNREARTGMAKKVCFSCPVRRQCLSYALSDSHLIGVWGGTSGYERRLLRSQARKARAAR